MPPRMGVLLVKCHLIACHRGSLGKCQTRRSGADDNNPLALIASGHYLGHLKLSSLPGIDQALHLLAGKSALKTGIVPDAALDQIAFANQRLSENMRFGDVRSRHRHQIGLAGRDRVRGLVDFDDPTGNHDDGAAMAPDGLRVCRRRGEVWRLCIDQPMTRRE